MSKTNFSNKCEILGSLWMFYKETEHEEWAEFFRWGDLGLPIAYLAWQNLATPKPEGKTLVEDVWNVFCEMIAIDPNGTYANFEAAFSASPNPPLAD